MQANTVMLWVFFLPRNPLGNVLIQMRLEVARRVLASDCLSSGVVGSGCFGTQILEEISACFDVNRIGHMVAIDSVGTGDGSVGLASTLPAVARDFGSRTNLQKHLIRGIFLKHLLLLLAAQGSGGWHRRKCAHAVVVLSAVHRENFQKPLQPEMVLVIPASIWEAGMEKRRYLCLGGCCSLGLYFLLHFWTVF